MRVIISNTAKAEIAAQIAYIRDRNPDAARRQRALISRAVAQLRITPRLSKPGRIEHTRELVIGATRFIIVYQVRAQQLEIIHVLHGRQQWPEDD